MLIPEIEDAEFATPMILMQLLPAGISGIVIAAYIAAVMSTADSCLIGPVAIFTNDIYHKYIRPEADGAALVRVARMATIVFGLLAIGIAYLIPNVLELILYAYTFGAAGIFFPVLGLLFWRRTTAKGAFWSMLSGGTSAVIWAIAGEPLGFSASYTGWIIGLPVLIIVSLMTEHSAEEDIDVFAPVTED
jgi:SSS family solute:Na+ symporter